jgi:hypothetical protein
LLRTVAVFLFAMSSVAGCATLTFRNYDVSSPADEQAATLLNQVWWGGGCPGCVEGIWRSDTAVVYSKERDGRVKEFRLLPGVYAVWYAWHRPNYCHGQTYGVVDRIDTVELQSGHVYEVRLERNEWIARCGTFRRELSRPEVWMEDQTTDQVVAGTRPAKAGRGRP